MSLNLRVFAPHVSAAGTAGKLSYVSHSLSITYDARDSAECVSIPAADANCWKVVPQTYWMPLERCVK